MKERIKWLDFLKGIAILFVVMAHVFFYANSLYTYNVYGSLISLFFTIIMPCFFAISGYLYRPIVNIHDYKLMIYKKLVSLGIPYIIFSILYVIYLHLSPNSPISFSKLFYIYSTPIDYLWFLYALLFMFIIMGILDLLKMDDVQKLFLCILMTIIGFIFSKFVYKSNIPFSGIFSTFDNIIYFYFGYIISKYKLYNKLLNSKSKFIIGIFTFVFLLIIQAFFYSSNIANSSNVSNYYNILTKFLGAFLLIKYATILNKNNCIFKYFDKLGKLTLVIYIVHFPIILFIKYITNKLVHIGLDINNLIIQISLPIIWITVAWFLSIFVCYLSKRIKFINFLFYPRKYINKLILRTRWGRNLLNYRS